MEEQLKKLKSGLKDELTGLEYNARMKRNVIRRFEEKEKHRGSWFRGVVPAGLSLALLVVFSLGIYWLVDSNYSKNLGETPPAKEEAPVAEAPEEEKPELIVPPYVPDGYVFKHTHTNEDLYEHLYIYGQNEGDYFAYIMRENKPDFPVPDTPIELAQGLNGHINKVSEEHIFLTWQDEGMYQIVERKGSMPESEFYKIAEAILKAKGHEPLLDELIREEEVVISFEEQQAVELLVKYNTLRKEVSEDATGEPGNKFVSYNSKEQLYQLFDSFMTRQAVEDYVEIRVYEENGGLYMDGMEDVRNFWSDKPYEFTKVSDSEYKLVQVQEGDMNGREIFFATFKNFSGVWKINTITTENDNSTPWLSSAGATDLLGDYHNRLEEIFKDAADAPDRKFKTYKSLEEINKNFADIATGDFLKKHLEDLVAEKPDGLYLVSDEAPSRYSYDFRSDLTRTSDTDYKLTQSQENNLYYTAEFVLQNGKWLINNIVTTQLN
ncbi:DUF4367 domain-containing protein [Mesobacillus boroniphilus]|uniref:DUF4367 domain-containing protein n=1 Tax=Mesobacillus boroniphilus TaxID=308892 RepID=A0A944CNG5_9BACI|nr:DUF4367 domain-containing protein [Mesobacillus boroniphilus]MBS8265621.1 DUF4367 domain-containing protein [Mesobacillus boroniphilus]